MKNKFVIVFLLITNEKKACVLLTLNLHPYRQMGGGWLGSHMTITCQLAIYSLSFVSPRRCALGLLRKRLEVCRLVHGSIRDLILWVEFSWTRCLGHTLANAFVMMDILWHASGTFGSTPPSWQIYVGADRFSRLIYLKHIWPCAYVVVDIS